VNAAEFVTLLRTLDVTVDIDGDQLRCTAPLGVLTDALRGELAARKTEIVEWLRADRESQREGPAAAKTPRRGDLPLSFAQQRLWFIDQLEPGTPAYTLAVRQRFRGPLEVPALANALSEVVRRHEALRTTFVSRDGWPVQVIADPQPVALPVVDLAQYDASERHRRAEQLVTEQAQRPFDLAGGPLIRVMLLRHGSEEHDLLISIHHIVADGWSLGILAREVSALYGASVGGRPSPLAELPVQYADFVVWQREWLTGELLERQRRYWLERLAGRPEPLHLPTDHPRSGRPTTAGASYDAVVPYALAAALRELSRRESATVFMTLLGAFKVLVSRYTGQDDILVGTTLANRHHVELEPLIGLFANTLVLRTDLVGDPTFRQALARVRETCLGAYSHPDMPFEKLVEDLQPARVLGENPLFEISFVFQRASADDPTFVTIGSPFELTLFVRDAIDGSLKVTVQYKQELFEPETIARLVGHYLTLLEGIAADPDRRLSALPLLDDAEAARVLVDWNATATPYPRDRSIHECFEEQVDATPDAVALAADGAALTYRELDRHANRLAHHLRALGVDRERVVGVWMDRSPELIVALLAILKSGGAYAAIDLLAPEARLAAMASVANIDLIVTHTSRQSRLAGLGRRTIAVDRDAEQIAQRSDSRPRQSASAESVAAVMYTSGSTGEPKGVMVTHRGILRLIKGTDYATFGGDEIFLQLSPPSFDASSFEIWGALLNGGRLAIAPPGVPSASELGALLARYHVTTLWLTAGLFQEVIDHGIDGLRSLRQLLAGGDILSPAHVRRLRATLPGLRFVNGYGPTEGTTFTCCHVVTSPPAWGRSVPIGRPIANTRVYVLDRHRRPVPIGVPGELWIAGDGLATGYVSRPHETAERFVTQRLSETLEERLYRSGDLVRWRPDSTLEFLGRLDDQVKIRGFRVECAEIEAALGRHPQVRASVVVARHDLTGECRLVAYVVSDSPITPQALRECVERTLPAYMVPGAYVQLDRLPVDANGKVDRRSLPEPSTAPPKATVMPGDALERRLVDIWQEVLSVAPIGIRDNFFDLGGHSLAAVRMFARLEGELGVALPLVTLFEGPTIESLATFIRDTARPAAERSLIPIQLSGSRPPIFGIPGVAGGVLGYYALARLLGPDQPFYGLQSRGLDGIGRPMTRIEDIAAALVHEIRQVQAEGPYYLLGMCMGGVVAYEMAQQLRQAEQEIGLLGLVDTWPPPTARRFHSRAIRAWPMAGFIAGRLRLYTDTLARLRGRERLAYLLGRLKLLSAIVRDPGRLRGARAELHRYAVSRANLLAFHRYEPRPYPGRIIMFRAEGRRLTDDTDARLRWRQLAGELEIYGVSCDDSGQMLKEPHVQMVAAQLTRCIQNIDPPGHL
jgi:amino acid adenylation domain-containing protein